MALTRFTSVVLTVLAGTAVPDVAAAQTSKHVLFIGLDGARSDAVLAADTPAIDSLAATGAFTFSALAGGPEGNTQATSSGPGWSSLLTGVWADKHLVTGNGVFTSGNFTTYPHFFARVRQAMPSARLSSIVQWSPIHAALLDPFPGLADDAIQTVNFSAAVRNQAVQLLQTVNPDALFLHFDDIDYAGHAFGFSPNATRYIDTIEEVDGYVADVMTAVAARPNAANEDWLVMVSTDHGGSGSSHGGQSASERRIFVISNGGDTVPGEFQATVGQTVIVPTLLRHLGIAVDPTWLLEDTLPFGIPSGPVRNPVPRQGEVGLPKTGASLAWFPAEGALSYRVHLGTSPVLTTNDLIGSPLTSSFPAPDLAGATTYFWRVDAVTASGTLTGPTWSFESERDLYEAMHLHLAMDNDLSDATGQRQDSAAIGQITFIDGVRGRALALGAASEAVAVAEPATLAFGASTDFTVSFWLRSAGWSSDPVMLSNKNWVNGSNVGWIIAADPDGVSWQWNFKGTVGSRVDFDAIAPVADGQWHHLCVVHDRDGLATFWQDGTLAGSRSIAGQGSVDNGLGNIGIGQDGTLNYGLPLMADLDDIQIWKRALGPAEIQSISASSPLQAIGTRVCPTTPNSVGLGGHLIAAGSHVAADRSLDLVGIGLPSGSFGIFFMGDIGIQVPAGAGTICAGGAIQRIYAAVAATPSGVARKTVQLDQAPFTSLVTAGTSWHFQLAYRDTGPSGAIFDFSDSVRVNWQ